MIWQIYCYLVRAIKMRFLLKKNKAINIEIQKINKHMKGKHKSTEKRNKRSFRKKK